MPIFEHFDILAPLYDRLIRIPDDNTLVEAADLPVSGRLLDAGGGTGRIAQRLIGLAGQVIVADSSVSMLREAQRKGGLVPVGSETESMPFPDACFERIVVVDAYHHLADQAHSIEEFWRVLMPGGLLVIEEPDIRHFSVKLIALAEKLALFRSHFVRAEKIAAGLSDLGAEPRIHRMGMNVWIIAEKV